MSKNKNLISVILSVVLSVACVAAAASAATTISTNVSTDGTLTVTGLTTLGNASTSVLSISGNSYLGTVSSGAWNGTAIGVAYGGTGATTASGARTALGLGTMALEANTGSTTITTLGTIGTGVWNGTAIGVTKGGTGLASYTANQLLYASGATTIGQIATSSLGLLTANVAEDTNLYWTQNRFATALAATTTDALAGGSTNKYYSTLLFAADLAATTTDALPQGSTNKYWSNGLFDARLAATTSLPTLTTLTGLTNASTTLASFGSSGTTIAGIVFGTCAVDPQSITASSSALVATSCSAAGVVSGDKVFVTAPTALEDTLILVGASASTTANYIEIKLHNTGNTGDVDGASRTWSWMAIR